MFCITQPLLLFYMYRSHIAPEEKVGKPKHNSSAHYIVLHAASDCNSIDTIAPLAATEAFGADGMCDMDVLLG